MPRIDAAELEAFATDVVEALGSPPEVAAGVAESLVAADLRGHGSHGTRRLATLYPTMIEDGDLDPAAEATVVRESPTAAQVDARNGWGHVAGRLGVDVGVEKAREHAVAAVGVRNATHMGRIGGFAERATDAGMAFVGFVNTGGTAPMAAAPGSTDRNLSVNPVSLGVPSFGALDFPAVLDIATGQVAHGKIMERAVAGDSLPEGWAIGDDGEPLTDAGAFEDGEGAIHPLGGPEFGFKGAGLSMLIELLAGIVADAAIHGQDVARGVNNAGSFLVVDPDWFGTREANRARVAALADHLGSIDYRDDVPTGETMKGESARLPGAPEHDALTERREAGIPLDPDAVAALVAVADDLGIGERPAAFE
jgi:uncharacterized oxidoreductase